MGADLHNGERRQSADSFPTAVAVRSPAAPWCWRWWRQQTQVPPLFQYYSMEPTSGVRGKWTKTMA